jgi:hypothetical protein
VQFINPSFLYALGVLAIPIAIHLFNFRRPKKLVFSDIRFLKQILQQNKKQKQIKHYLILLFRILALTALVFAFANPFIPKGANSNKANVAVFVYIDNSFSMNAKGKDAELLELAKNKARSIVNAYGDAHTFQLLTNDFLSKHRVSYSKKEMLNLIDEVSISTSSKSFNQVFSRQKSQSDLGSITFWIGDAQESQIKLQEFNPDSNLQIRYLPVEAENTANVWIDTVWLSDPNVKKNQGFKIFAKVKNGSGIDLENQSVSLLLDGNQKAIQTFSCKENSSEIVEFQIQVNDGNWHKASVKITDFPISFDDEYYFTFKVSDEVNILQVFDQNANPAFAQLYQLDPIYKLQKSQVQNLKYSEFNKFNFIILDNLNQINSGLFNELERFVREGGIVAVLPSPDQTNYNEAFSKLGINFDKIKTGKFMVNNLETNDPIFNGVFNSLNEQTSFPDITKVFGINIATNAGVKSILKTDDASPFLIRKSLGKGQFYIAANDLSSKNGNFSQHAIFVPLFLQMPFQVKSGLPWSYLLGKSILVPVFSKNPEQIIKLNKEKEDWICESEIIDGNSFATLPSDLKIAGFYTLNDQNKLLISKIALNFQRNESNLKSVSNESLVSKGFKVIDSEDAQLRSTIAMEDNGISLWRYFLMAAFLFFLLEMLFLKSKK